MVHWVLFYDKSNSQNLFSDKLSIDNLSQSLSQSQIETAKEELFKQFEQALEVSDRMIRSNLETQITRKFEKGFAMIEKECRELFERISDEVLFLKSCLK